MLCRFTDEAGRATLKDRVAVPGVYAAGRLDADSEGLVLLTDDGALQHRIADPRHKLAKTYIGPGRRAKPDEAALAHVARRPGPGRLPHAAVRGAVGGGARHGCGRGTRRCVSKSVPTSWLEIVLREGKNRQVRRMTAKVGLPTLRLIRVAIGPWRLDGVDQRWRSRP